MITTLIPATIARGSQDLTYSRTVMINKKFKVRITIKSDSYKAQCFAKADVWSADKLSWNNVTYIAPSLMKTEDKLYYWPASRQVTIAQFLDDESKLLADALAILI